MMSDVLILTARYGHGHLNAAQNIKKAFHERFPSISVELMDPFLETVPRLYKVLQKLYTNVSNHFPYLWYLFFTLMDHFQLAEYMVLSNHKMKKLFTKLLDVHKPKVIISTYPIWDLILRKFYGASSRCPFKIATVITDSVTINKAWLRGDSDIYFVADELTAISIMKKGVDRDKIVISGFPTPPVFANLAKKKQDETSGISKPITILFLPNKGTRHLFKILEIMGQRKDLRVILALGKLEKVRERILKKVSRLRCEIEVMGWIPDVCNRMIEADMVITKAGGATVHEAISAGCAVIISQVTPGQEEGNARYIESNGVGIVVRNRRSLTKLMKFFNQIDYSVISNMKRNSNKIRKLNASYDIAHYIARSLN